MRIAQIAPLAERCPPRLYGGTERIVSWLTEELVSQGHDVTLFASGDSVTSARLVPCSDSALRLDPKVRDQWPWTLAMIDQVRARADDFDVLHFHVDLVQFPVFRDLACKTLTTLHGRLDIADLAPFYRRFSEFPLVSISRDQRRPMPPEVHWAANIPHGLPRELLTPQPAPPADYLAFLGRISPEKRPDRAIDIALQAGAPLRIAAKIDRVDEDYWRDAIAPLVEAHPSIDFVGEIGDAQKAAFLGGARALLFPIDWPEPFGLVMIEAMACGTPVIAFRRGSAPEVIEDGVTGFLVDNIAQAVAAVGRVGALRRSDVRAAFERRFSATRMAQDYVRVYESLAIATPPDTRRGPLSLEDASCRL